MDPSDIVFSAAKMLKYLGFTMLTDIFFGIFVLSWLVTRQVGLLLVIVSLYEDMGRLVPLQPGYSKLGPYDIVSDPL